VVGRRKGEGNCSETENLRVQEEGTSKIEGEDKKSQKKGVTLSSEKMERAFQKQEVNPLH